MKYFAILFLLVVATLHVDAHTINYQLGQADNGSTFIEYLLIGFEHIIPAGLDHILFIMCIFFLNTNIKQILVQASMFTLAHSITLCLAVYGLIKPTPQIIEPLIAVSILFLAVENIYQQKVRPWRTIMVFLFGLVHGMGFAGALSELSMPSDKFANALISFNLGVELGQIAVITFLYLFVSKLFSQRAWYRRRVVVPTSLTIALVAGYWTIERIFFQ